MYSRAFNNEDNQNDNGTASNDSSEPAYQFEGFKIEFSDKVMLTPSTTEKK